MPSFALRAAVSAARMPLRIRADSAFFWASSSSSAVVSGAMVSTAVVSTAAVVSVADVSGALVSGAVVSPAAPVDAPAPAAEPFAPLEAFAVFSVDEFVSEEAVLLFVSASLVFAFASVAFSVELAPDAEESVFVASVAFSVTEVADVLSEEPEDFWPEALDFSVFSEKPIFTSEDLVSEAALRCSLPRLRS